MGQSPDNPVHTADEDEARQRSQTLETLLVVFGSLAVFVIGVILVIAFAIK